MARPASSLFFVIAGDPRTSPRPAEAIRIAAGVGTWRKADVWVCLVGPAVLALGEHAEELVDGDNFIRYLPIVAELGRPVLIHQGRPGLKELGSPTIDCREISTAELASLMARSDSMARF